MAFYATFLTNLYGWRLKKSSSTAEKKRLRIEYSERLLSMMDIHVIVKGIEKLPDEGRLLLIANHRSIIDPLIIELALKDTDIFGHWVSKKELYDSFFFGLFVRNGGSVLLDRESRQMGNFFSEIKSHVSKGDSIFLFPEGTRNKSETELADFKDGARIIAMKNRLPILPVYIRSHAFEVLDNALNGAKQRQEVIVEIGDLLDYKDRSIGLETSYRKMFALDTRK